MAIRKKKFQKINLFENNQSYEAQIYFTPKAIYGAPHYSYFSCQISEHSIHLENKNVDALISDLKEAYKEKTSIIWTDYFEINIGGYSQMQFEKFDRGDIHISVEVSPLKIGINSAGEKFYKEHDRSIQNGEYQTGDTGETHGYYGRYTLDKHKSIVLDTPENRAALEKIAASFNAGIAQLHSLFTSTQIQKTLMAYSTGQIKGFLSSTEISEEN